MMGVCGGDDLARMVAIRILTDRMTSQEHLAKALPSCTISALCGCASFFVILMTMRYIVRGTESTTPNQFEAARHRTWMQRTCWHGHHSGSGPM